MKIEEKVPVTIPNVMTNANPRSNGPPRITHARANHRSASPTGICQASRSTRVTLEAPVEDREYESSGMLERWLAERSLRPLLAGLLVALFLGELLLANRTQRAPTGHAA